MNSPKLAASCRVAFAAYLHDLGKFAERAKIFEDHPRLEEHLQLYARKQEAGGRVWYTHRHAAHTALAFDALENHFPDLLRGDLSPFAPRRRAHDTISDDATDSLVNAAAMHHKPDSALQWIIAAADRIASGFERDEFERYNDNGQKEEERTQTGKNHYQARQLTLFENIRLGPDDPSANSETYQWVYPLQPLSPRAMFPQKREAYEPANNEPAVAEYRELWDGFQLALELIPAAHRQSWPMWLDHFDTLWLTYTHALPSATAFGVKPDVSLYDHSKTTAAIAVALWRAVTDEGDELEVFRSAQSRRSDWDEKRLLLIQGDFFGIQDYVFGSGAQTQKHAAKLLRGRSFYVSLLTELAALKVLEALDLPPTSQIVNAAGKFLIVAPNTAETRQTITRIQQELDDWFLQHTLGLAGIGIAALAAAPNEFVRRRQADGTLESGAFRQLTQRLFQQLDIAKYQRYGLCGDAAPASVRVVEYPHGVCPYDSRLPAEPGEIPQAAMSRDQITAGAALARPETSRVVIGDARAHWHAGPTCSPLQLPIFGYRVALIGDSEARGDFNELAQTGALRRCWDVALPQRWDQPAWTGYARRLINAYVPLSESGQYGDQPGKYGRWQDETTDLDQPGKIVPLNLLACEDRRYDDAHNHWRGAVALGVLKGDVDNLGKIFQQGQREPTFARMAALSRQIHYFFAAYLPWLCRYSDAQGQPASDATAPFRHTYTVFAGGDDFFLIGPWRSTQRLASVMARQFEAYVAHNPDIHFSAGLVMAKPGFPIPALAQQAEESLAQAKTQGKNRFCLYQQVVAWAEWPRVEAAEGHLNDLRDRYRLSTGYRYGLIRLADMAGSDQPEDQIWRSWFSYRTHRYVVDKLPAETRAQARAELLAQIGQHGLQGLRSAYRIPLFNQLYSERE